MPTTRHKWPLSKAKAVSGENDLGRWTPRRHKVGGLARSRRTILTTAASRHNMRERVRLTLHYGRDTIALHEEGKQ